MADLHSDGTAVCLDGDVLAATLRRQMAARATRLRAIGVTPKLATVLVGDNPASASYIARKHADCAEIGIKATDIRLPAKTSQAQLLAHVAALNADPLVHGLMVQLPLPAGLDDDAALAAVDPAKDIDGLHPENLGRLLAGTPGLLPCTPHAIWQLLRHHQVPLKGAKVVIIGRGPLVGRPLSMLLSMRGIDASVTLLHSASRDIAEATRAADVVIAALGRPGFVTADMVRPGAAVVGVGITYGDGCSMVSDVAEDVASVAGHVTPPHGSVGPLTRAALLQNLLEIAERGLPG
jgi:methylenetetrahydrofolate dehydrogenase (NADP+) / methenyltetrahydrofolate cyclohydrolase